MQVSNCFRLSGEAATNLNSEAWRSRLQVQPVFGRPCTALLARLRRRSSARARPQPCLVQRELAAGIARPDRGFCRSCSKCLLFRTEPQSKAVVKLDAGAPCVERAPNAAQKTNSWRATTRPARIASVKDAALIWNLSNIDHCHGRSLAQTGDITAAPIRCHR